MNKFSLNKTQCIQQGIYTKNIKKLKFGISVHQKLQNSHR